MNTRKDFCHKFATMLVLIVLILVNTGCGPDEANVPAIPSEAVATTSLPPMQPTETSVPTHTPLPIDTPVPTVTPIPTETPTPFVPKATIRIAVRAHCRVNSLT
jgi:hypothetical protein